MMKFTRTAIGSVFVATLTLAACGDSKPDDVAAGDLAEACTSLTGLSDSFADAVSEMLVSGESADEAMVAFGGVMATFMDSFGDVVYYLADDKYVNNPDDMRDMAAELETFADDLADGDASDVESVEALFADMDKKMSATVPDFKDESNLPPECADLDL